MKKIILLVLAVLVIGVAWYLISPLFIETVVEEDFPFTQTDYEEMVVSIEELGGDSITVEELQAMTVEEIMVLEQDLLAEAPQDTDAIEEEIISEVVTIASGAFVDADDVHKGSGTALLLESDGTTVLRLEDFETTNGPDLRVYLAVAESPDQPDDLDAGYLDLGKLKGNKGNQNYEIPADVDLSSYNSVVIYCKPFHVIFTVASLN